MVVDRQIQEIVARCVSTMVYYHNCPRSGEADERMAAEVQGIAASIEDLPLAPTDIEWSICGPVEAELLVRYGHEVGPRIFRQFAEAFEIGGSACRLTRAAAAGAARKR